MQAFVISKVTAAMQAFVISKVINPVASQLELPSSMGKLHNGSHVGLIKAYFADAARVTLDHARLADELGPVFEVEHS